MSHFPYQYTYLLIDFFTVIICFIFSFHKKINFAAHFSSFIKAGIIVAIPFIIWDIWFTQQGVWWFDTRYTTGLQLYNLPIEEVLFFICIPFACVFTYYTLTKYINWDWTIRYNVPFMVIFGVCMVIVFTQHHDLQYTAWTSALNALTMLVFLLYLKPPWVFRSFVIYLILLPGFFLVNGILTGSGLPSPVVNYNSDEFLNVRMVTIPIEDSVYGYLLIVWNLWWFQFFESRTVFNA